MTQSEFVDESVAEVASSPIRTCSVSMSPSAGMEGTSGPSNHGSKRDRCKIGRRGDYEVLALLRRNEPDLLTPVEVAKKLLSSQSGMTGKLDRLEAQGLIQRLPDPRTGGWSGYVSRTAAAD
ncbi:MAG: MarR family transcriptional regulator [Actinomycetota bacterium]|nr:MarR family transcriptional regulator [Actinomycetota bacterium]